MENNKFIIHTIILAVATIVSKIINVLYAIPLYQIIGEEGNGYYGTAYEIYNMLLVITAYSMPFAMSRIMTVYISEQDYVNCNRLFHCGLFYVTVVGGIASLVTYFFAGCFVIKPAVMILQVMAPTIFISGYLSVIRGYLQAQGTMLPTAISQVLEQMVNAILGIIFAYVFVQYTSPHPKALGALGSAVGTFTGVLVALLFIVGFYFIKRRSIKKDIKAQEILTDSPEKESYFSLIRVIFLMISPIVFTTFIYNLSNVIDMELFWWWAENNHISSSSAATTFGIYSRQYLVLIGLPIAIATAISSSMMPDLTTLFRKKNSQIPEAKISKAVRAVLFVTIPVTEGYVLLANPIMQFFFKGTSQDAGYALMAGAISIVFFSVSVVLNAALQGMNKSGATVINVVKALVVHVAYVVAMLKITDKPLEVLVSGSVLYSFVICSSNMRSVEKQVGGRFNLRSTILKPVLASTIMGFVIVLTYNGIINFGVINSVALIVTIVIAMLTYFAVMARGKTYTDRSIFKFGYMENSPRRSLPKILNMLKFR